MSYYFSTTITGNFENIVQKQIHKVNAMNTLVSNLKKVSQDSKKSIPSFSLTSLWDKFMKEHNSKNMKDADQNLSKNL